MKADSCVCIWNDTILFSVAFKSIDQINFDSKNDENETDNFLTDTFFF